MTNPLQIVNAKDVVGRSLNIYFADYKENPNYKRPLSDPDA